MYGMLGRSRRFKRTCWIPLSTLSQTIMAIAELPTDLEEPPQPVRSLSEFLRITSLTRATTHLHHFYATQPFSKLMQMSSSVYRKIAPAVTRQDGILSYAWTGRWINLTRRLVFILCLSPIIENLGFKFIYWLIYDRIPTWSSSTASLWRTKTSLPTTTAVLAPMLRIQMVWSRGFPLVPGANGFLRRRT